ncbi:unnamed protein product [Dicrocoelium dendriticum]|nr:unnamed protein product [Dicrocoelium dendriticum]
MLGVVLQSADSDVGQSTTECQVPSLKRDVKFSGQSKLPAKVVWRWIIESQLSSTLKVPFISSLQDLDSMQGHNLTFLAVNSLLVIEIELAHSQSEQEGQLILEHACLAGPASIRAQALGLLNAKSKSKRTRYQRRAGHDDTSRPSTPSDELLSACRFSKTKLQLLFSALSNCASKVQFSLPSPTTIPFLADLKLGRLAPVILAGRYVKLSRRLPQTPWIVDNVRKLPSSVEELIVLPMKEVFGQSSIFTFTASGREDVDVRCLGLGRPFILKIENYEASLEKVICLYSEKHGNRGSKLDVTLSPSTDNQTLSNIDLLSLATLVNSRAGNKLFIRDLQVVRCSDDCHAVKRGELEKPKCYMAVCWCPQGGLDIQYIERMRAYCNHQNSAFPTVPISYPSDSTHTWDLTKTLWQFGPITLVQRTPIRALHRRSALERVRSVHLLRLLDYRAFMCNVPLELDDYLSWSNVYPAEELFIIDLRCDAGTYVKEFIHGDLGRTRPSLASIFQCQVDILALDVVSIELDWPPRLDDPKFLP